MLPTRRDLSAAATRCCGRDQHRNKHRAFTTITCLNSGAKNTCSNSGFRGMEIKVVTFSILGRAAESGTAYQSPLSMAAQYGR